MQKHDLPELLSWLWSELRVPSDLETFFRCQDPLKIVDPQVLVMSLCHPKQNCTDFMWLCKSRVRHTQESDLVSLEILLPAK